jgi:SPP1 gp7 family putative phage head morphogenesis protein
MEARAYWERRSAARMSSYLRDSQQTVYTVSRAYRRALRDIQGDLERIFESYANTHQLTPTEARAYLEQQVSQDEYERLLQEIARVEDPEVKRLLQARADAPAYRYRMTRAQALSEQLHVRMGQVADAEIAADTARFTKTIQDAYGRTMFDIQRGTGYGFSFTDISTGQVREILRTPWSGEHFSSRIWGNTQALADQLNETITAGFMSGRSIQDMADDLEGLSNMGRHAAVRVIRTETNFMANAAEIASYKEAGIKRYRFLATLDNRTSEICFLGSDKVQTLGRLNKVFRRPYSGEIITITTSNGKQLSGTPNHPILTPGGWLPLDKIEPHKQVVYTVPLKLLSILGIENVGVPTEIAKLFNATREIARTKVGGCRSSTTKLDSDAEFINNEINVAAPDGILRNRSISSTHKRIIKDALRLCHSCFYLFALKALHKLGVCRRVVVLTPEIEVICLGDGVEPRLGSCKLLNDLAWAHSVVKQFNRPLTIRILLFVMLAALKLWHRAVVFKEGCNRRYTNGILFGKLSSGRAVPVFAEDVISVRREPGCIGTHVYNLQTSDSLYFNDTILVHNCQELDGQVFDVDEAVAGVNMPPMHPHCRSTTVAEFDDMDMEDLLRRARDPETEQVARVPREITYKQWREQRAG